MKAPRRHQRIPRRPPLEDELGCSGGLPEPSEYQEQCSVAGYLDGCRVDGCPVLWCHVPNEDVGGAEDLRERRRQGAMAKAAGVKPGVPDVLVFTPPPGAPGARGTALELKRRVHGEASPDQERWLAALAEIGWITAVHHGSREAVEWLKSLGYAKEGS